MFGCSVEPRIVASRHQKESENNVIYEKSCGIIPFRRTESGVQYLLLHSGMVRNPDAAWEFPKGSMEEGEDEEETALREVQEEVCLTDIHLLPDFRDQVNYVYRRHGKQLNKTVIFFLGEVSDWSTIPEDPPSHEHKPHPKEGRWFVWVSEREAERRLFHPGMRKLLSRASLFLFEYDRIRRKYTQS